MRRLAVARRCDCCPYISMRHLYHASLVAGAELVEVDGLRFIRKRPAAAAAADNNTGVAKGTPDMQPTPKRTAREADGAVVTLTTSAAGMSPDILQQQYSLARVGTPLSSAGRVCASPVHAVRQAAMELRRRELAAAAAHDAGDGSSGGAGLQEQLLHCLPSNCPPCARLMLAVTHLMSQRAPGEDKGALEKTGEVRAS